MRSVLRALQKIAAQGICSWCSQVLPLPPLLQHVGQQLWLKLLQFSDAGARARQAPPRSGTSSRGGRSPARLPSQTWGLW